eukprot:CAMPEP_0197683768 /NCGR_PEP_ID=MMETSP1338-20131121/98485_1 /TAXON_ID=43686 ORGANISM="Pelagodinium beii, Strain RCC1491" /NCGR_SAMPLE_ID=MMETSP1338 /ASSEMBLY_ACC=CAM_ASM_000754 /LENGTH=74 /DNA_ID=CAMNT_0043265397 /DNA_START=580 /DNA_END=804 /DNA_ORIENTATION=-
MPILEHIIKPYASSSKRSTESCGCTIAASRASGIEAIFLASWKAALFTVLLSLQTRAAMLAFFTTLALTVESVR